MASVAVDAGTSTPPASTNHGAGPSPASRVQHVAGESPGPRIAHRPAPHASHGSPSERAAPCGRPGIATCSLAARRPPCRSLARFERRPDQGSEPIGLAPVHPRGRPLNPPAPPLGERRRTRSGDLVPEHAEAVTDHTTQPPGRSLRPRSRPESPDSGQRPGAWALRQSLGLRWLWHLSHPAPLIVDEIGYLPVTQSGATRFFQLVNPALRERRDRAHLPQGLRGVGPGPR